MKYLLIFSMSFLFSPICRAQDSLHHVKAGYGVPVQQTQPEFPGGRDSLRTFLRKNVRYPKGSMNTGERGKVWLSFQVDTTGQLLNPAVLKSVSPALDSAALDVLQKMPLWIPATTAGQRVESQYLLQIEFVPPGQK